MSAVYRVKRNGKRWDVVRRDNGAVVEGGFFTRDGADSSCAEWNRDATGPGWSMNLDNDKLNGSAGEGR